MIICDLESQIAFKYLETISSLEQLLKTKQDDFDILKQKFLELSKYFDELQSEKKEPKYISLPSEMASKEKIEITTIKIADFNHLNLNNLPIKSPFQVLQQLAIDKVSGTKKDPKLHTAKNSLMLYVNMLLLRNSK